MYTRRPLVGQPRFSYAQVRATEEIYVKFFYHRETKERMTETLFNALVKELGNAAEIQKAAYAFGYTFDQEATLLTLTDHVVITELNLANEPS